MKKYARHDTSRSARDNTKTIINLDAVKTIIRELLLSNPEKCMTIAALYNQYWASTGEEWPYRQLNFRNSHEFLLSIPDTVKESLFQNNLEQRLIKMTML